MNEYVLDASVALKWYLPETFSAEALRFLSPDCQHHVPAFFVSEFANTIWKKVGQRGELSADQGRIILTELKSLPLKVHYEPFDIVAYEMILKIGNRKLAIYDFIYLALAESMDLPLVTADQVFFEALSGTPYSSRLLWVAEPL
jgi:predicted nucleic acid-binding protein